MKKKCICLFCFMFPLTLIAAQEQKLAYFGTVYNTFVNDDHVNIREYPSLDGQILCQVNRSTKIRIIGVSKGHSFIDNYNGNWLQIEVLENQPNARKTGWIFSKYVATGKIAASELKIVDAPPKRRLWTNINCFISTQRGGKTDYILSK